MSPDRRFVWLLLALAALLPYLSGWRHDWTYDDHGVIVENAFLSDPSAWSRLLTLQTLRDASVVDGQRPVVVASYLIDRAVWGLNPAGFRTTNLALHVLATLLVFGLLKRLADLRVAAVAALLFAVHPLAVEAVISPAFREDLLYLVFGLVFLTVLWSSDPAAWRLALGSVALVFAMLSKESAVMFPAVLAAGWWCYPSFRPPRSVMGWRLGVAVVLAAALMALIMAGRPVQATGAVWNGQSFRGAEGWWSAPWLAVSLFVKMWVPHPLSVDYVVDPVRVWTDPRCWLSVLALAVFIPLLWRKPSTAHVRLGLIWMILLFIPVSNIVPLYNPVADRYAYGILPGFALFLSARVMPKFRSLWWLVMIVVVMWACGSTLRVRDWRNDRTLWTAALEVEPRSARAHTWLGLLEKEEGRRDTAWDYFLRAESLNPHDPSAKVNRAVMLGETGDLDTAESMLREVLAVRPDHASARKNLDYCLYLKSRPQD